MRYIILFIAIVVLFSCKTSKHINKELSDSTSKENIKVENVIVRKIDTVRKKEFITLYQYDTIRGVVYKTTEIASEYSSGSDSGVVKENTNTIREIKVIKEVEKKDIERKAQAMPISLTVIAVLLLIASLIGGGISKMFK